MASRLPSHRRVLVRSVLGALTLACAIPAPLLAQAQRVAGPFAALFGGPKSNAQTQSLEFRGTFGVGYDTNMDRSLAIVGEELGAASTLTQNKGLTEGATADLTYDRRGDRVHLNLIGATTLRGARAEGPSWTNVDSRGVMAAAYDVDAALDVRVRRKLVIEGSSHVDYAPFFQLIPQLLNGQGESDLASSGDPFVVLSRQNRTLTGSVGATSEFTRRSRVSGSLSWKSTRFPERSDSDLHSWAASTTFIHRLSRSWSLGLGGSHEEVSYTLGLQAPVANNVASISGEYGSDAPLSRRTIVSASGRLRSFQQGGPARYRFEGDAQIARGFGRTWSAGFGYSRSTQFVAGIAAPLFMDSVMASVNGLIVTRVQLSSRISASRGGAGLNERQPFVAYGGSSKLTIAMTRNLGVYGQYAYYRYQLPAQLTAVELGPQLSRYRITAGVSWWLPLATETRVLRDPR